MNCYREWPGRVILGFGRLLGQSFEFALLVGGDEWRVGGVADAEKAR